MPLIKRVDRALSTRPTSSIKRSSSFNAAEEPDVGFVACIEGGVLEAQALLLFESIRRYTGRFKNCSLYALSPRAGHAISTEARRKLDHLGVHYSDKVLNTEC